MGLRGRWTGVTPGGEAAQITLAGINYTAVIRGAGTPAEGSGTIFVDGNKIVFTGANLACSGEGRGEYFWSLDGDVLRFEPDGEDECAPRVPHLVDIEYTLVDPLAD